MALSLWSRCLFSGGLVASGAQSTSTTSSYSRELHDRGSCETLRHVQFLVTHSGSAEFCEDVEGIHYGWLIGRAGTNEELLAYYTKEARNEIELALVGGRVQGRWIYGKYHRNALEGWRWVRWYQKIFRELCDIARYEAHEAMPSAVDYKAVYERINTIFHCLQSDRAGAITSSYGDWLDHVTAGNFTLRKDYLRAVAQEFSLALSRGEQIVHSPGGFIRVIVCYPEEMSLLVEHLRKHFNGMA